MTFVIPGYAILARVTLAPDHPEGAGYFCAFGVRAASEDAAREKVRAHLLEREDTADAACQDARPLVTGEMPETSDFQSLGDRIYIAKDAGGTV